MRRLEAEHVKVHSTAFSAVLRWGTPICAALILSALMSPLATRTSEASPQEAIDPGAVPDHLDVPVEVHLSHTVLPAGGSGFVAVIYRVPPKAHIQVNDFFTLALPEGAPATLGQPILPKPVIFLEEPVYPGTTTVFYPIRVASNAPPGSVSLAFLAGYQACLEEPVFVCFAPEERTVSLPLEVGSATTLAEDKGAIFASVLGDGASTDQGGTGDSEGWIDSGPGSDPTVAERLEHALKEGSFLAYLLVFIGGFLTSFTPCVYPMIPITISYIGGSSKTRLGGLLLSLFFVLGIAIMYSGLGLVAAKTGALFGSAMQSTPVLVVVSLVFLAMGASMLGAFDLALPSSLQTKLSGGPRSGVIGAVFMGAVTGIVASPCVGPVLVVLLTWVAKQGSMLQGFTLLFTFACGLGLLFLVIGTFAGALNALPSAGHWMDTVKHVFGVILMAMSIYYVRSLLGPHVTWMLTGLLVLLTGTFVGAFRQVPEEPSQRVLLQKGFGIAMVLCGGFALLIGLAGYAGVAPTSAGSVSAASPVAASEDGATEHPGLDWVFDDEAGRSVAMAEGKPVVMDFYADWCTACKELDHKTWVDETVRAEGDRFVAVKLDFTQKNEWSEAKYKEYEIRGLPTVIFFDSQGKEIERFFGFRGPESVLKSMRAVK